MEAGESPQNLVHRWQVPVVSLKPHEGENYLIGHIVPRVRLITIVEEDQRTEVRELLRNLGALLQFAGDKWPVPIWDCVDFYRLVLKVNEFIMQFDLQWDRFVFLEFLQEVLNKNIFWIRQRNHFLIWLDDVPSSLRVVLRILNGLVAIEEFHILRIRSLVETLGHFEYDVYH